jgi:hypothetical protein
MGRDVTRDDLPGGPVAGFLFAAAALVILLLV